MQAVSRTSCSFLRRSPVVHYNRTLLFNGGSAVLKKNTFVRPLLNQKAWFCSALVQPEERKVASIFEAPPSLNPVDVPVMKEEGFAVVHISGKQEKVTPGDVILTEKLVGAEVGDIIRLDKVLLIGTKDATAIGTPRVKNAYVLAEVQEQTKAEKIIIFKKKRRKGYQNLRGYRPDITVLYIKDIHFDL